jgi:hypothetical protein
MWTVPFKYYWLMMSMLLAAAFVQADELPGEEELPSVELLEFLAEWQTREGEFTDPETVQELPDIETM